MTCSAQLLIVFMSLVIAQPVSAQSLDGDALVKALRNGGYVIVMRHASSPREVPNKQTANPDNVKQERQLDEAGRAASVAMGRALRDLKIPVGEVLTSPTYRALETVRLAQLADPRTQTELGDGGQSMQGVTDAQAAWLRDRVTHPPSGTNTIIVTHMPNISRLSLDGAPLRTGRRSSWGLAIAWSAESRSTSGLA